MQCIDGLYCLGEVSFRLPRDGSHCSLGGGAAAAPRRVSFLTGLSELLFSFGSSAGTSSALKAQPPGLKHPTRAPPGPLSDLPRSWVPFLMKRPWSVSSALTPFPSASALYACWKNPYVTELHICVSMFV